MMKHNTARMEINVLIIFYGHRLLLFSVFPYKPIES